MILPNDLLKLDTGLVLPAYAGMIPTTYDVPVSYYECSPRMRG